MRAIALRAYGGAEALEHTELPDPIAPPDGVVVRTHAAGVNPVDWKIREGYLDAIFPSHFPLVPGWDVAGTVESVGPGVPEHAVGDRVIGYVRNDHIQHGTYAERVVARPRHLARAPERLDLADAAGLPLAGLTAWQGLQRIGVGAGDRVVVHGAAGGVGVFAVQLARILGAQVWGTASPANHDFLRELGATPLAYGEGLTTRLHEATGGGLEAAYDAAGTDEAFAASVALLDDPQRLVTVTDPAKAAEVGASYWFVRPDREGLAQLVSLVDEGRLQVPVARRYPLVEAAAAHRDSEAGHVRGKLVLTTDEG